MRLHPTPHILYPDFSRASRAEGFEAVLSVDESASVRARVSSRGEPDERRDDFGKDRNELCAAEPERIRQERDRFKNLQGQSIAEVLVAIAVGGVLIGGALSLILPSLRSNTQVTNVQAGSTLARGMLDNVRVFSEGGWGNLLALATGSANTYFLQTGKSPFSVASGTESVPYDGITSGLVGWWKLDDGFGSTTVDSSGNGNDGAWSGTPAGSVGTYYNAGKIGQYGGAFNGTNDWVTIPTSPLFNLTSTISLAAWFKTSTTANQIIIGKCYTTSYYVNTANNIVTFWTNGSSLSTPSTSANNGAFHLVVATFDGTKRIYVDGVQLASAPGTISTDNNNVEIGSSGCAASLFNGSIDDVRIYNRALSASEITQIYADSYKRYFYLNDVWRASSGTITTPGSGSYDPSTKQVVVGYSWSGSATQTLSAYLTRNRNNVTDQTDWSGGATAGGTVVSSTNNQFATSSNIDFSSLNGSFSLPIAGSGSSSSFNGYGFEHPITITSSMVSSTLSNFPMLFAGTYNYLAATSTVGGTLQSPNGYDYIFTSDSGCTAKLNFEQESYVSSTGAVVDWVQIPSLTSSTVIYLCNDNAAIVSSQQNAAAVWDANYKGVWHLPNGTSLTANDSTGVNNGTLISAPSPTAGKIDGAASLNGSTQTISVGNNSSLNTGDTFTIEAWINPSNLTGRFGVFTTRNSNDAGSWQLEVGNGVGTNNLEMTGVGTFMGVSQNNTLTTGAWQHIVGIKNGGGGVTFFINGVSASLQSSAAYTVIDNASVKFIGEGTSGAQFIPGSVDEVRYSNSVRSSGWILTEYNNQSNPNAFYTVGP